MKVVYKEYEKEIFLKYIEIKCPFCESKIIARNQIQKDKKLNQSGIKEFLKKDVILLRNRRICKSCGKTFSDPSVFTNKIFDERLRPILKVLFERDLIKVSDLDKEVLIKLKLNDNWKVLKEDIKILTLINKISLEIIEFSKIKKTTKIMEGKKTIYLKDTEYKPFFRKIKFRTII